MVRRLKLGLIYTYNKDWVGGAYYILNLIEALNTLPDQEKPELTILSYSENEFEDVIKIDYPYISYIKLVEKDFWPTYRFSERLLNKISRTLGAKNVIFREHTYKRFSKKLDVFFPASSHIYFSNLTGKIFWIPDFQEHFLPQFFTPEDIRTRKQSQERIANNGSPIVFSSHDAMSHFKKIYPSSVSKTFVAQFAVTHPSYENLDLETLLGKYKIPEKYYFCTNQFWGHKNHMLVLKAIKQLHDQGKRDLLVVFSGREYDYRNPDFFAGLKSYVNENKLEEQVRFLGFIDRSDQLQLMNNSIAVIQPSLFEGWSTVVEDAKSMNKFVIASNLGVHKEQMDNNVMFFDPLDPIELAELLQKYWDASPIGITEDYNVKIRIFGETFLKIARQVSKS
jgi:glycosyltransferase involved in cell wall biosynthesis